MPSACNRLRNAGNPRNSANLRKNGETTPVRIRRFFGNWRAFLGVAAFAARLQALGLPPQVQATPQSRAGNCGKRVVRGRSGLGTSGLWLARSGVALKCSAAALKVPMLRAR